MGGGAGSAGDPVGRLLRSTRLDELPQFVMILKAR